MLVRKRKTKNPCSGCGLNLYLCICAQIPNLDLKTRVTLLIHYKELKRTTNTGRLAIAALRNSEMHIRGQLDVSLDLSDLLMPEYQSCLFFPTEDAQELTLKAIASFARPINLIVPDGNWRQASKVVSRHKEIQALPRFKLTKRNAAKHHLRAENSDFGMSTLQAVAEALAIIEGVERAEPLHKLYQVKLRNTLMGRGVQM